MTFTNSTVWERAISTHSRTVEDERCNLIDLLTASVVIGCFGLQ
ncbi:hypothetical protein [Arthrobacter sp. EpRS71]|nr:hypothetical protein [Arthrobacter sp. EpRS71]